MKGIRRKLFSRLSLKELNVMHGFSRNEGVRELIDEIRLNKWVYGKNTKKVDGEYSSVALIRNGQWDYPLINVHFVNNMIINASLCILNGMMPRICFKNSMGEELYGLLFDQPFPEDRYEDKPQVEFTEYDFAPFTFPSFPTSEEIKELHILYSLLLHPNAETQRYFNKEYDTLLKGKKVLGVLCRGTDYVATKPSMHPVQPEIEEVITKVASIESEFDSIYLATEEEKYAKMFREHFPGRILENRRNYYDHFYDIYEKKKNEARISQVHFDRENDSYLKSLEYWSSLNLLSKCDSLIAGNCGGSKMALYLNGGEYSSYYLFNKGVY